MKFVHGFLAVLGAWVSYFVLSLRFGVYQRYPVGPILLAAAGIVVMIIRIQNDCSLPKLGATLFSVVSFAVFVWWSLAYSAYGGPAQRFGASALSAEQNFSLRTTEGKDFDFNAALKKSKRTLLVFNRGVW